MVAEKSEEQGQMRRDSMWSGADEERGIDHIGHDSSIITTYVDRGGGR